MDYEIPFFVENVEKNDEFFSQLDEDFDFALALSLQSDFESEVKENDQNNAIWQQKIHPKDNNASKPLSIVDKQWELLDPHPDINGLFLEFNKKFFDGLLEGVEVKWSSRMTLCAGVCSYEGRGGLCSVRLSMPLLKLRPRRDLVETLLHEMIHALLFVTNNNKDHDGHGPEFRKHMNRINDETGTRISIYHNFNDEVDLYRKHWWKCNGPCQKRSPYFGIVKRAMNRAPGPRDTWWSQHQSMCGGSYTKINEPTDYKSKSGKRKALIPNDSLNQSGDDIRNFFKPTDYKIPTPHAKKPKYSNVHTIPSSTSTDKTTAGNGGKQANVHTISSHPKIKTNVTPFTGKGFTLGSSSSWDIPKFPATSQHPSSSKGSKRDNTFTGKKDKSSVSVRIPGFYNSTAGTSSSSKGEGKNIGNNNRSFGGGTGSTRMRTATGSKTIVLKKPSRSKTPEKIKPAVEKEPKLFSGQGKMLGNSSSSTSKEDWWHSTPSKDKHNNLVQSPIEKYLSKATSNDSSKDDFKTHDWSDIFSDSDDSFIIGSPSKNYNVESDQLETASTSAQRPPEVVDLSDIACEDNDTFSFDKKNSVVSNSENASTSVQRPTEVVDLLAISNDDIGEISYVRCPVCNKSVKNTEINNHLDMCLT